MATRNKYILIGILVLAALACGFAVWHFRQPTISPLTPQLVKDAQIPAGWYEHEVVEEGNAHATVLTKHAELGPTYETDDLYDDPEIRISTRMLDASTTPEEYIRQYGTQPGTWGTLDAYGYKIFTFDTATGRGGRATGHVVDMFKDHTIYIFMLVSSRDSVLDTADFWSVINHYAQAQTSIAPPVDEETALAQLQADVQNATPHFIPDNTADAEVVYTPEEKKIRDDVVALFAAQSATASPINFTQSALVQLQNDTWLDAIGTRYLLVTEAQKFAIDGVLDTQTGKTAYFYNDGQTKRYYLAPERSIALYIEPQALFTYALDQATTTLVAGSRLVGTETYHDGYIDGATNVFINPEETHTTNSITISVFDSSKSVPNPGVPGMIKYAKVGQKSLSF